MNLPASPELTDKNDPVTIVGEYTTPSGPYFDDHFLVIILRSGKMLEYPSQKSECAIPILENILGIKINFRLSNRTDAASRVLFPIAFAEHPLFDFKTEIKGFHNLLKIIRHLGATEISMQITKELEEYLREEKKGARGEKGDRHEWH